MCGEAAGLPPAASRRLAAAFELGRRVASTSLEAGAFLRSSQQIRVEDPKNHRPRSIRMNQTLRSEVARHALAVGQRRRGADRQVIAGLDGKTYTEWVLRTDLAKAVSACGEIPAHKKPKVTTHVLRHTAASLMVAAGVPIFDVAKVLGHETIQVTMRYAHFAPEAGKAAVEALDKILDLGLDADRVEEELELLASGVAGGASVGGVT